MAKWGSTDFRQLVELQERINKMASIDTSAFCRDCSNELAQRLYRKVVKNTPTGRKPKFDAPKSVKVKGASGKTRSFLTKEGEILQKYWSDYQGGTLKKSWTVKSVTKKGDDYICEVINPQEYASYVEYGHRQRVGRYVPQIGKRLKQGWVEGNLVLTVAEKDIKNLAPRLIEKLLQEKLEEMMNGK